MLRVGGRRGGGGFFCRFIWFDLEFSKTGLVARGFYEFVVRRVGVSWLVVLGLFLFSCVLG